MRQNKEGISSNITMPPDKIPQNTNEPCAEEKEDHIESDNRSSSVYRCHTETILFRAILYNWNDAYAPNIVASAAIDCSENVSCPPSSVHTFANPYAINAKTSAEKTGLFRTSKLSAATSNAADVSIAGGCL